MFRRYPTPIAILAASLLLVSWPGLARAQTGYTQLSNTTLGQAPYKYCGMVICQNATNFIYSGNFSVYNVGGGAIAEDPRLVQSCVSLPYNFAATNSTVAFTQKNYFVLGYNSTAFPNPVPANAKPLRGYVYGAHYASLVASGGLFDVATIAVSYAVFYSNTPLTGGTVPSVVDVAGVDLGTTVTKLVVGYAGTDYTLYQTGPISEAASSISDPLWYFPTPSPIIYPIFPFMGGSVWVKESGQWAYEGVALISGGEILDATFTGVLSGTAFELMNTANLQLITNALAIVGSGRSGPPRPSLNATNVYASVVKGKDLLGAQHVQVSNGGNGLLRFATHSNALWLSVSPSTGATSTAPVALALNFLSSTLAVGTYNGVITVSNSNGVKNVNVQLQVLPDPVPIPTGVSATRNRNDGILLTWKPVAAAVKYEIYRGPVAQANHLSDLGSTTLTDYLDTTAAPLQSYHYFVRSINAEGRFSGYSKQVVGVKNP